jgi:hypothetical protein
MKAMRMLAALATAALLSQSSVARADSLGGLGGLGEGLKLRLELPRAKLVAGDLDFNLLDDANAPKVSAADLALEERGRLRRTVLTTHQIVGLSTLGLLAATVVVGQLNYMDRFSGSASNTARFELAHSVLAFSALAGFAATGALGLFAPVPYPKERKFDTTVIHKLCMAGATLGMMSEMGLGLYTAGREGYGNQRSVAIAHQVIGFSTLGLMTIGAGAFIF